MILKNNTDSPVTMSWCVADHWAKRGDHEPGKFRKCETRSVTIPPGGRLGYDETDENGAYITALCSTEGFD